jgi:cell pole-organizing protein PopZ
MAQANSAQREPSMEEILASIRRIIEDSDTAKEPVAAAPEPASAPSGSVIEVESFRADLRASTEAQEAGRAEPAASQTFADFAAAVKRAPAGEEGAPGTDMQDARLPKVSAVDEALAAGTDDDGLDQDEMIAELSEQLGALAAFEPEQKRAAEPKSGILSEQAGRQVAASFGELTEAFSSNRRRSFEEMAEEMMRPMLQDWLDNNLPVLVERLVREEIERVARGASS